MTVDELGSSTIILLPSCDTAGNCYVGEISVESDAGQVILNQAFQATVVDTLAGSPMKPVILGLTEDMIGNLLIVARPTEITEEMDRAEFVQVGNALDLDFLKFGKDESTGIITLNEEPEWLVIRETESNYFELRLDQEYGYSLNIVQGDAEIYDYEIGGNANAITIIQSN